MTKINRIAREPVAHQGGRIGIADVVSNYGIEEVHRRIAQLRATGLPHAATAIERELRST
ncbi:hypothetical protein [Nocardia sp. NPDC004722]